MEYSFFDESATFYDPLGRPSPFGAKRFIELNDAIAAGQNAIEFDSTEYHAFFDALEERSAMLKHLSIPAGTSSWSTVLATDDHTAENIDLLDLPPACEVHFHS